MGGLFSEEYGGHFLLDVQDVLCQLKVSCR